MVLLNLKIGKLMYLKFVMQNVLVSYPGTISLKVKGNYVLNIPTVTLRKIYSYLLISKYILIRVRSSVDINLNNKSR